MTLPTWNGHANRWGSWHKLFTFFGPRGFKLRVRTLVLFTPVHIADFSTIRLLLAHPLNLCQRISNSSSFLHFCTVCLYHSVSVLLSIPPSLFLQFPCINMGKQMYHFSAAVCVMAAAARGINAQKSCVFYFKRHIFRKTYKITAV